MNQSASSIFPLDIVTPISNAEEVGPLAEAGATEFYCGVSPAEWTARHGSLAWVNRRGHGMANLQSLDALKQLIERAHGQEIPVKAAMNAPCYAGSQLHDAVRLCREIEDAGIDGLIVSDVALLLELKEAGLRSPITLSSVASIHSVEACRFFMDLGVSKIVLPRHVSLEEIRVLRTALPELRLEVFVLNDGCVYEEGHCATTHALGAFCSTPWDYTFASRDGQPLSSEKQKLLEANIQDYREWVWYTNDCGCTYSPRGLPNGPCGLCALWDLARMGVHGFKIVGREAHPFRKLRSVQLVKAIVDLIQSGEASEECQATALDMRSTPDVCALGYMCLYREASTLARSIDP